MFGRRKKNENRGLVLGKGISLEELPLTRKKLVEVVIPDNIRNAHWITFGGSRTGKSRLLMHAVRQGIAEGRDLLVIDPKFEKDLFPAMVEAAIKAGRKSEVIYIDAVNPERSTMKINPFAICKKPDEVVELILAAIPPSGEQFFREFARKVVSAAISLAQYDARKTGRPLCFTISKLNHLLSYNWIKEHYDRYRAICSSKSGHASHPKATKIRDQDLENILLVLGSIEALGPGKYEKYASNLSNALSILSLGLVRSVIDTRANPLAERIGSGSGVICYIYTGGLVAADAANMLGRLVLSSLQMQIGRVYLDSAGGKLARTLEIHCDEAASLFYPGVENLFNKAGGAGVWLHFLTQSLADIDNVIGRERRSVILDSCASKVFLCCGDAETTGRYVAALAGETDSLRISMHVGMEKPGSSTFADGREPLLDSSAVTKLVARQFFAFIRNSGNFKGEVLAVADPGVTKDHCEALVMEIRMREAAAREVSAKSGRANDPMPFFGAEDHAFLAFLREAAAARSLTPAGIADLVPHREGCPRWAELVLDGKMAVGIEERARVLAGLGVTWEDALARGVEILRNDPEPCAYDDFREALALGLDALGDGAVERCAEHLRIAPSHIERVLADRGWRASAAFQVTALDFLDQARG